MAQSIMPDRAKNSFRDNLRADTGHRNYESTRSGKISIKPRVEFTMTLTRRGPGRASGEEEEEEDARPDTSIGSPIGSSSPISSPHPDHPFHAIKSLVLFIPTPSPPRPRLASNFSSIPRKPRILINRIESIR